MSRQLSIELDEILGLVHCAEDYGHGNDVLLCSFASMTGLVSDDEIQAYAAQFTTPEMIAQGYGEESRAEAVERLTAWRDRYEKNA